MDASQAYARDIDHVMKIMWRIIVAKSVPHGYTTDVRLVGR